MGGTFEIFKALSNAVVDHGGNDDSLRRLKTDKDLLARIARLIAGPIWDYVDVPFDLEVNWDEPWQNIITSSGSEHASICTDRWLTQGTFQGGDKKPEQNCRYTLRHYPQPVILQTVQAENDCATFRELRSFACICKGLWSPSRVVAARIVETVEDDDCGPHSHAPMLVNAKRQNYCQHIQVDHCSTISPIKQNHFFLVRI